MAFPASTRLWLLQVSFVIYIFIFTCKFGRAYGYPHPGAAGVIANEDVPEAGDEGDTYHHYPEQGSVPEAGGEGETYHHYPEPGNVPEAGGEGETYHHYPEPGNVPEAGGEGETNHHYPPHGIDPAVVLDKALKCLNDKYIYSSCEEAHRLTQEGELNVQPEYTDQYCSGPCLKETHLVLECIAGVLEHFEFYNKATLKDVSKTIEDGCSYGPKRGDFNVAEHVQDDESGADTVSSPVGYALVMMMFMVWHFIV